MSVENEEAEGLKMLFLIIVFSLGWMFGGLYGVGVAALVLLSIELLCRLIDGNIE